MLTPHRQHPGSHPTRYCAVYQSALDRLVRFARDDSAPILLHAESGTGKTSIAQHLHAESPRAGRSFKHVVLSTLDAALASSDLFGHVAGAFTDAHRARAGHFVSADRGTLFLDEVGKASLAVQEKLLHAIEYGEIHPVGSDRVVKVDVRIIVATNVDLMELVESGRFLPDLYARLATFRVRIPPLRERRADVRHLVDEMIGIHARCCGYDLPPDVEPALLHALQRAPWPYNLRQLDATIHRIMIEAQGAGTLSLTHCVDELEYLCAYSDRPAEMPVVKMKEAVRQHGSISAGARALGIDRKTLRRHLKGEGLADMRDGGEASPTTSRRRGESPDAPVHTPRATA